ncbi:MAG: hypothetical protein K8R77_00175 [Anaerolineaceae bacterium]|nr:hypothetical protein [Anaerolineaceae bacterium]
MSDTVRVECYASSTYPQRPRVVHWQGQRLVVEEIEAQWRHPDGAGFRLCTSDGQQMELLYLASQDCWRMRLL